MKIHRLELRHVRHFKELVLDLTAPLVVIAGSNGVGKTTLQRAILLAMFHGKKEDRDALISRYDPQAPPHATLHLSRGGPRATITLSRTLTDDKGEWREGTITHRQKGEALQKMQGELPISAEAAASLLWGLQEDMARVVSVFPSDGHSLLAAATIKGGGPDPKEFASGLENEIKKAKNAGKKEPGSLTRAGNEVQRLDEELLKAGDAAAALETQMQAFKSAKNRTEQAEKRHNELASEVKRLSELEKRLAAAVKASAKLAGLLEQKEEWEGLDTEFDKATRTLNDLKVDQTVLMIQFRVARDKELGAAINRLREQIKVIEAAEEKHLALKQELKSKTRPDPNDDVERLRHQTDIKTAKAKMEANGVRYSTAIQVGTKSIRISEDGGALQDIVLKPDRPHTGVVGNLVISVDDFQFSAGGKEDIAALKRALEQSKNALAGLFERFDVPNDAQFQKLLKENANLSEDCRTAEKALINALRGSSLAALRSDHQGLENDRCENGVSSEDRAACKDCLLDSTTRIKEQININEGEHKNAEKNLKNLQARRRTEMDVSTLTSDLKTARQAVEAALHAFHAVDVENNEPSPQLLESVQTALDRNRTELRQRASELATAEKEVTRLATELKHAGPNRPLAAIEVELAEAKDIFHREEVWQEARKLLVTRVHAKIEEMAANIPRQLADSISSHLAALTNGAYSAVLLSPELGISSIVDGGATPEHWQAHQLSTGERNMAALAVKVAVARALAETAGTVFVILDECMASFDPDRRAATESLLLDLVSDGRLQVIFLTCHSDWARAWHRRDPLGFQYVDLAEIALYYRSPCGLARA